MVGPQTHWKQGLSLSHALKPWKMHPKGHTICTFFCCSLTQTPWSQPPTTKAHPIEFNRPLPASCCLLQLPGESTSDSQGISRKSVEGLSHRLCNSRGFQKNFFKALMHSFTFQSFDSIGLHHKAQQAGVVLLAPEPAALAAFLNPSFKLFSYTCYLQGMTWEWTWLVAEACIFSLKRSILIDQNSNFFCFNSLKYVFL